MIKRSRDLDDIEARYVRAVIRPLSYHEALERFVALWEHARKFSAGFPGDWKEDVQADIELKRVMNAVDPRG